MSDRPPPPASHVCVFSGTMDAESVAASQLPAKTLYEYIFDIDDLRWRPWRSLVPEYVAPADGKFSKILVPTVDTVRSTWLLSTFMNAKLPVLFVGDSGTAKTVRAPPRDCGPRHASAR